MKNNKSLLEKDVLSLFHKIKELKKEHKKDNYLLENTYFLDDGRILSIFQDRMNGVSRFPYSSDGFTLWAYSSGHLSINESTFYVSLPSEEGKEPYLAFFGGELLPDNTYLPISILGRAFNPLEKNVERYCIYAKDSVYYLTKTRRAYYALRAFVSKDKKVSFSLFLKNRSKNEQEYYLSSYFNSLFKYSLFETMETKWFKKATYNNHTFYFESPEDVSRNEHILNFGKIRREMLKSPKYEENTTSRSVYLGSRENQLVNATSLRSGHFSKVKLVTHFSDTAIAGDLLHYTLKHDESVIIHYTLSFSHSLEEKEKQDKEQISFFDFEKILKNKRRQIKNKEKSEGMLKIYFEDWNSKKINTKIFNRFLEYVIYQTEYCGLAKNSGALFLGVRDVMQQLDATLIWNPSACRKKILEVLSFIDSSGNPPRQYSLPPKGSNPKMDFRDFIDQGLWIIHTLYAYLAYTLDYSILDEVIGYYDRTPYGVAILSKRKDSVLDHLIQIMDYLMKHIDPSTHCLRAMYGDWNDALDGLGITSNKNEAYGDGVSIMATLQFYKNLLEMYEILIHINKHLDLASTYLNLREDIKIGIKKYAIVEENGVKRILHGWGEHRSYLVGSYHDVDGKSRNSSTANAFYVLSDFYKENIIPKEDFLKAYHKLDSKYGFKTFEPYFASDCKGVGRIVHLPLGTAENAATYIHSALFSTLSLFYLDEEEYAYRQLEKLLPFTHEHLSTSPFVMPNSYSYNEEEDMDGESMSDWYTGSANTLLKTIIKGIFGIQMHLDYMEVHVLKHYPARKCSLSFKAQNHLIHMVYSSHSERMQRIMKVNGEVINGKIIIDAKYKDIKNINIEIID